MLNAKLRTSGKLMFCADCEYSARFEYSDCQKAVAMDALDLINRQKEEIERLKGDAPKFLISDKTPSRHFKEKSQQPILIYPNEETVIELVPSKEQIEFEAIKEFWKKLKEKKFYDFLGEGWEGYLIYVEDGDNLVKEMIRKAVQKNEREKRKKEEIQPKTRIYRTF